MAIFPNISVGKNGKIGEIDLGDSFYHAAQSIFGEAYDGIIKNHAGRIGQITDEIHLNNLLVSFYLLRHAIELTMKRLAEALGITKRHGHKLRKLWDEILKHPKIHSQDTVVNQALVVLDEYNILHDEQLFRYENHNDSSKLPLKEYPAISAESFQTLSSAYDEIRIAILVLADIELRQSPSLP